MKKYFLYELKKSGFTVACLAVICTIVYLIAILETDAMYLGESADYTLLNVVVIEGGILAFCIPFRQFEYKMKKRKADLFFALPLSHTKILTVKYLAGLIIVFAPYTAAYLIGALAVIMRTTRYIYPQYYPLHFLSTLIPIYIIYAMSSFAYTRAGKSGDGALNAICWATVLTIIALVINLLTRKVNNDNGFTTDHFRYIVYVYPEHYLSFAPLFNCTNYFANMIAESHINYGYSTVNTVNIAVGFTLTGLMGTGATAGMFLLERKAKFEDIEQISKSPFELMVMLPLFTVCISALCVIEISLYIIFAIAAYLVTAYYKRTLKIGKWQAVILAASLVAGLIIGVIAYYAL